MKWYDNDLEAIFAALAQSRTLVEACRLYESATGRHLNSTSVTHAFGGRGWRPASYYLGDASRIATVWPRAAAVSGDPLRSRRSVGHADSVGDAGEPVWVGDGQQTANGGDGQHRDADTNIGGAIGIAQQSNNPGQFTERERGASAEHRQNGASAYISSRAYLSDTSGVDSPLVKDVAAKKPLDQKGQLERGDKYALLLKHTRRAVPFAKLCDMLDASPSKVRALVNEARTLGYTVSVAGDEIGWQEPEPAIKGEQATVLPTTGAVQRMAVISDLHAGSKYFLRKQLADFLDIAYDWAEGHLTVVSAGDNVDGCYKHGQWELTHHGLQEQIDDLLATVKQRPGMDIYFIDGNHCGTFWDATGYPTGVAIEEAAKARGRTDWHYVGNRGAMLKIGGARVELWHPKKGGGYALSYALQNKIRDTALGHKPDFLIAGHWHHWVALEQRGIHALAAGTFQGAGSAFSKSLGGAPSIGGTLLSWELTEHGTLRRVATERIAYYEIEAPREVA